MHRSVARADGPLQQHAKLGRNLARRVLLHASVDSADHPLAIHDQHSGRDGKPEPGLALLRPGIAEDGEPEAKLLREGTDEPSVDVEGDAEHLERLVLEGPRHRLQLREQGAGTLRPGGEEGHEQHPSLPRAQIDRLPARIMGHEVERSPLDP